LRQPLFALLATALGLIGLSVLAWYLVSQPTTLRVAVGPVANENVRVVSAAIQTMQREREPFRLRLMLTEGTAETAAALDEGRADLAIVRTDIGYPRSGATVAIMQTDHLILIAPAGGPTSVTELAGKSIGLLRDHGGNRQMLEIVLRQSGVEPAEVTPVAIRQAEIRTALDQKRIAAVMIVAPITSRVVADAVNVVAEAGDGDVAFIPVPEANAIEQRHPLIEAETILRGSFGGMSPRPEKDTPTLTVSHHLLAAKSLADATVADFTRVLITAKAQIAAEAPLAARIEAPDQEKASPIPIHPGTITYLDGQTTTFLERYGDWFYIGIMGLGLGGSLLAGWLSVSGARSRAALMERLEGLDTLLAAARAAPDEASLTEVDAEADRIFAYALHETVRNNMDAASAMAFNMAITQVREAVIRRRRVLGV
jgi:TRAP transporter TAXI family solute receptor